MQSEGGTEPPDEANDAHDAVDVQAVLSDLTVVIPTNRERNHTAASVPDFVDTIVRTDNGRSIARNRGVEAAETEWVAVADDDITFPTRLTAVLLDGMHDNHLIGVEDVWPMEWALTRYMLFHRDLWERVGGFDEEREHGEDTDFCIRAEKVGATVCTLPRRVVPHHDRDSAFNTAEHLEWLWYLLRRHPRRIAPKAARLVLSKAGLLSPPSEYGPDWQGATWATRDVEETNVDGGSAE